MADFAIRLPDLSICLDDLAIAVASLLYDFAILFCPAAVSFDCLSRRSSVPASASAERSMDLVALSNSLPPLRALVASIAA